LKKLPSVAALALTGMPRGKLRRLSARERAEVDDLLTMMRAMADERKTATVYFEMAEAMGEHEGRPPSEQELVVAKEICEGLQQERLTDEERQAIDRLARKSK
jgi:hypothetical protein